VVVACESCSTRFRIDDARIPAKGRLVRCSQCKATFVAMPANVSFEDTVQEAVAEVTAAGGVPVPEPATDLFDTGGEDLSDRSARPRSDEERWEFDETPRASAAAVESKAAFEEHFASDDAPAPLDEVGEPGEWNLLRESVEPEAREARFVEPAQPAREPAAAVAKQPVRQPVVAESTARRPAGSEAGRSLVQLARFGLTVAAWAALAALAGVALLPLFSGGATLRAAQRAPQSFALEDGEAHGVRTSFVENAFAGTLLVIQGELSRPQPDRLLGLRVHLVDAAGKRLGENVWAGAARPERDLRELEPKALQSGIDASAAAAAQGGRFVAVLETIPSAATDFELALEPLPVAEPPPTTGAVGAEVAPPPEASAVAEPTASSPPATRPSSG
jgi:predicted Zn finger-like uncharacterized protein